MSNETQIEESSGTLEAEFDRSVFHCYTFWSGYRVSFCGFKGEPVFGRPEIPDNACPLCVVMLAEYKARNA